ncbi:hypothetical protein [Guptibacillus algicola]|uniref:hypothetical protein n=1 Tax=Guptibacillus algicola TaxID=225844 RepID=UPI001CD6883E|nr:hypothetical protein [Alkalihalobacillus algicola]MCA0985695.1 hypothetical protein [Alkalihalobacillus algicola]
MNDNLDIDEYKIVEIVKEDNVIIFTAHSKNGAINKKNNNEYPKIAYFTKFNGEWHLSKTGECLMDKWNANLVGESYLWCGTLTGTRHEKVIVGDTEAKMIEMNDDVKRVWYHLSENNKEEVKVFLEGGSEEWLKEIKY